MSVTIYEKKENEPLNILSSQFDKNYTTTSLQESIGLNGINSEDKAVKNALKSAAEQLNKGSATVDMKLPNSEVKKLEKSKIDTVSMQYANHSIELLNIMLADINLTINSLERVDFSSFSLFSAVTKTQFQRSYSKFNLNESFFNFEETVESITIVTQIVSFY